MKTFKTAESKKDFALAFLILYGAFFVLALCTATITTIIYIFYTIHLAWGFSVVVFASYLLYVFLIGEEGVSKRYKEMTDPERRKRFAEVGRWFNGKEFYDKLNKKIEEVEQ